tara:strand:+ start:6024 stop:8333 length:2310 start_codon:yes stop_codon:yes gene_type:complete
MAETLISPGVLARENDQSQVTSQPVQAGAAIVGPTVLGKVGIPKLVTSYSEYLANFGSTFQSGSDEYTYFTSISAYNYFNNGGTSLIVNRVASGSWAPAVSTTVFSEVESGIPEAGRDMISSYTAGGTDGTAGTYTGEVTTVSPAGGSGLTVDVTTSASPGKLVTTADELLASITVNPTDCVNATYTNVSLTGGTGTGAVATVVCSGNTITGITVTTQGSGYVVADSLTIAAEALGTGSSAATIVLVAGDILVEPTAIVVNAQGSGYAVGDVVSVAAALIGSPTADLTFTLVDADIVDTNAFTLETLTDGAIMNSVGPTGSNGTLDSGSQNNIRWEIQAPNTSSGVFSLIIRQGNDTATAKSILEIFPNVSLDPKQSNYISRIVGDQTKTLRGASTVDPYCQVTGSYPNASRYVRVKEVALKTPDYFDNNGTAKSEFTASIPRAQSGSFQSGTGDLVGGRAGINYYDQVNNTDSQGMGATEMGSGVGLYTTAFNLLANRDDYRYNIITAPGLLYTNANHATPLNTMISNTQGRGDAIAIMDLENYGSTITAATGTAASVDNSYVASYWPWLQIADPDSRQLVWVCPSSMIPGVYAFNDKSAEAWFAPAGINRGGLSTVVQAERKLTQTNRDDLYTGKVNPIATFPGRGVVVFGQKTLQASASALDRVNVRRLLIELKSYISQIADNLVFEQNTAATRNNFLGQVNPYLESVQQRQGLYAFKVVMDASNNGPDVVDRNQMVGAIYLQPTKTAEFIYLDFNILPTGATFPA